MVEENRSFWPGWETVRRIGSGGFGTVYEIQRDVYGRLEKAALKVITIPHSEDEVDYLRCTGLTDANITQTLHKQVADIAREYNLMVEMRENPNVVRCDDFRDIPHEDGLGWDIYIKMELLTPLMKCLDKVQTEEQILKLGMDICNALIACQEKNIIHRDIKPQNIFISDKGQFKLGDFGIARTAERTTRATAGIGTYSYMAPEVEKNEAYGKTADIYSLGLVLYWLLNERRSPFMPLPPAVPGYGDEEDARNRRFRGEQIPAPINGSDELKAIILKACAYDPKERYQSAKDMLSALEALKAGSAPVEEPVPVTVAVPTEDTVEPEDLTVGPGWDNNVEEPVAEDSMTVGPTWGDAPITEETEVTVGSAFHEKKNKQPQTDPEDKPKDTPPKLQKKKWTILWVMVAIAAMLLAVFIFFRPSWKNINGKTYYYVNRERVTGWQTIHGHRYFFGEDGAMQTGWQPISDGWGDDWYYFGDDGIMQDGRQIIDGKVCDFSGGTLQTGWVTYDGNIYYYILNVKQTGWRIVDGVRYYFDANGIMQTNWQLIDGEWYKFDEKGLLQHTLKWSVEDGMYKCTDCKMKVDFHLSSSGELLARTEYSFDDEGTLQKVQTYMLTEKAKELGSSVKWLAYEHVYWWRVGTNDGELMFYFAENKVYYMENSSYIFSDRLVEYLGNVGHEFCNYDHYVFGMDTFINLWRGELIVGQLGFATDAIGNWYVIAHKGGAMNENPTDTTVYLVQDEAIVKELEHRRLAG